MATVEELTQQIVNLHEQFRKMQERVHLAEQELVKTKQASHNVNREDEKRLYPDALDGKIPFKEFQEYFLDWVEDRDEAMRTRLEAAATDKSEGVINISELDSRLTKRLFRLLKKLVRKDCEAKQIMKNCPGCNPLEAWRRLCRRFDPQTDSIHALNLRAILGFCNNGRKVDKIDAVPVAISKWEKAIRDYMDCVGEEPINDMTRRELLLQLLPTQLEELFRTKLLDAPATTYHALRQLVLDRIHEASALATPMAVDGLSPGQGEEDELQEHWHWEPTGDDDGYWVCSVGKGPRASGVGNGWGSKGAKGKGKGKGRVCWYCSSKDHLSFDCPKAPQEFKDKMKAKGKAKGKGKKGQGQGQ